MVALGPIFVVTFFVVLDILLLTQGDSKCEKF